MTPNTLRQIDGGAAAESAPPRPAPRRATPVFPFTAIVGQDELKRVLCLAAIDARLGARWTDDETDLRARIVAALDAVEVPDRVLEQAVGLCTALGADGLRGELTLMRAARALAALGGEPAVTAEHLKAVAPPALRHRLRRDPLDESDPAARIERAVSETL